MVESLGRGVNGRIIVDILNLIGRFFKWNRNEATLKS
jgi:hypothetical protein